jgi:DNA-binding GntR family transcriptional regulator
MSPRIEEALPKYVQIANYLRTQILQGELKPGDEIPSERQLVEGWQVSRPTATRALSALRVEGLVEARQGSGTFVRAQPKLYRRARDRYAQGRATVGMHAPGEQPRITSAGLEAAPEHVAAGLGIDPELPAIRRQRVVFDGDIPVEMSTSWFTQDLAASAPRLLQHSPSARGRWHMWSRQPDAGAAALKTASVLALRRPRKLRLCSLATVLRRSCWSITLLTTRPGSPSSSSKPPTPQANGPSRTTTHRRMSPPAWNTRTSGTHSSI